MLAKDIEYDLKKYVGGGSFIRPGQLAKYLGQKNAQRVKAKYLDDLPRLEGTTSYFIPDVAKRIYQKGEWASK